VSLGIGIGGSYVPNNDISRDGLGDIVTIDNDRGRSKEKPRSGRGLGLRDSRYTQVP
jgi:hypothetical protein